MRLRHVTLRWATLALGTLTLVGAAAPPGGGGFEHVATFRRTPGTQRTSAGLAFSADGSLLLVGGSVIDLGSWQWLGDVDASSENSRVLEIPGDSTTFLLAEDSGLSSWEMNPPRPGFRRPRWPWSPNEAKADRYPFAKRLPANGGLSKVVVRKMSGSHLVALSPDGRRVAAFEGDRKLILRDAKTGEELSRCEAADIIYYGGQSLSLLGGRAPRLIFGNARNQYTWDLSSPFADRLPADRAGKDVSFRWFAAAPPAGRMVGGRSVSGRELVIWDDGGTQPPATLPYRAGPDFDATCGALTPDGLLCYVGHENGVIRRVDLSTGAVATVVTPAENRYTKVGAIALSSDGRRLAWGELGGDAVHVYEVGGRRLLMGVASDYFPADVGTAWVYRDTTADGTRSYRRRVTVLAQEVLGAARCFLVRYEREEAHEGTASWTFTGVGWYAVTAEGVHRVANASATGSRHHHLRPILEVPAPPADEASGRVEPRWVDDQGESGSESEQSWIARRSAASATVLGAAREVIEVDWREKDSLKRRKYAAGVGLYESRTNAGMTALESFHPASPAAPSPGDSLSADSIWEGTASQAGHQFNNRLTITSRTGDKFKGVLVTSLPGGTVGRVTVDGRIIDGTTIEWTNHPVNAEGLAASCNGSLGRDVIKGTWKSNDPRDPNTHGEFRYALIR